MTKSKKHSMIQDFNKIARIGWQYARAGIGETELSSAQCKICVVVSDNPGLSQDDVARELGMDKSSIAKLTMKLVEGDYILRKTDPNDRRQYNLFMTAKGQKTADRLNKSLQETEKKILSLLDGTEKTVQEIAEKAAAGIFLVLADD